MPATMAGAKRKIKYHGKSINKDCFVPVPIFWASYLLARKDGIPDEVSIDMNEEGVLTITPVAFKAVKPLEQGNEKGLVKTTGSGL